MSNGFDLRKFLKDGFIEAVGQKPSYKIRLDSAEWLKSGVLLEEDLAEIQTAIEQTETSEKGEGDNPEAM